MALYLRLTATKRIGLRSRAFARHLYQKAAALTLGAVFVSPIGRSLRQARARYAPTVREPNVRTAVVAHLFYIDLLPEILDCHSALPELAMLHLTVPTDRFNLAMQMVRNIPNVTLHPCTNRGRDIGPFIKLLNEGTLEVYDAVLKLHTKRSPHLLDGEIRRKLLFNMLAGERNATRRILALFEAADTGIVGWKDCYREAPAYWMGNEARVKSIAAQMGATDEASRLGFFEGSMFWFRPAALTRLQSLQISQKDFEPEAHQLDATLHHALERCFTIAARASGFSVRDLTGRLLSGTRDARAFSDQSVS